MNNQYDNGSADIDRGVAYYQQGNYMMAYWSFYDAAQKGNVIGMNNVSVLSMNGQGTPKSEEQAFIWMERAAKAGYAPAYYPMASKFYNGIGTEKNIDQAKHWAEMAMNHAAEPDKTNAKNMYNTILKMSDNGNRDVQDGIRYYQQKDYAMAYKCFSSAVEKGNATAMNNMSLLYLNGYGVEKDIVASFEWMKKAAEAGYIFSYFPLASKYHRGFGTPKDNIKAKEWAEKATKSNISVQEKQKVFQLLREIDAEMNKPAETPSNKNVSNVPNDRYPKEYTQIFNEACALYNSGNYKEALTKLEYIGKKGYPGALRVIGQAYIDAKGVKRNIGKAYDFLKAAAYRGDQIAAKIIALRLINRDEFGMWKAYAQMKHIDGCEQSHVKGVIEESNRTDTYVNDINALDAMIKAAECWRNYERHTDKISTGIGNGAFAAKCHFEKATGFGNADGLCGKALYFESFGNEQEKKRAIDFYKLTAYCGHSYAMYRVAKYYDSIDIAIANKCYLQAAEWGYTEAKTECMRRNIK